MDTTGMRVMAVTRSGQGSEILIGTDAGAYGGTAGAGNVRRLDNTQMYPVSIMHPAVMAVTARGLGYGCGQPCGRLYPITPADEAAIIEAAQPKPTIPAPRETRQASMLPCPICHTYCSGDCRP